MQAPQGIRLFGDFPGRDAAENANPVTIQNLIHLATIEPEELGELAARKLTIAIEADPCGLAGILFSPMRRRLIQALGNWNGNGHHDGV